ncbi:MAG: hypothetical protein ABEJ85_01090 [Haloarculaceae archaeon]
MADNVDDGAGDGASDGTDHGHGDGTDHGHGHPIEPGTNALVLAPALSDERSARCLDLLDAGAPADLNVLRISYSQGPDELCREWTDRHGELPARFGIVTVNDQAGLASDDPEAADHEGVALTSANPNDVTGLGMRLNNYLAEHDPALQLVVCFDSLTQMLQFTDVQSVFKFVHMFTGQLREVDAIGHFHLDPNAHDTQTVSRLKPAFDDAVDLR